MDRRWVAVSFLGITAVAVLALAVRIWPVLVPLGLAVALAYAILPLVLALEARGLHRAGAILVVYAGLGAAVALVAAQVVPAVGYEIRRLTATLPEYSATLDAQLASLQDGLRRTGLPAPLQDGLGRTVDGLVAQLNQAVSEAVQGVPQVLTWLLYLVLAPVLAFYLLRDRVGLSAALARILPRSWRHPVARLLADLDAVAGGFVRGQLVLSLAVGAMVATATALLGLRHSMLLGLFAGVTELIPYIGPLLGAIPAVALGFAESTVRGLQVVLAFALIQQMENAVVAPKVMSESVGLHPVAVILVVLAGGLMGGVWGAILAVPATGALRALWRFGYRALVVPRWPVEWVEAGSAVVTGADGGTGSAGAGCSVDGGGRSGGVDGDGRRGGIPGRHPGGGG